MQNLIQVKFGAEFLAKKAAMEAKWKAAEEAKIVKNVPAVMSEEFLAKKRAMEAKWAAKAAKKAEREAKRLAKRELESYENQGYAGHQYRYDEDEAEWKEWTESQRGYNEL